MTYDLSTRIDRERFEQKVHRLYERRCVVECTVIEPQRTDKEHVLATIRSIVHNKQGKIHPVHALYAKDLLPALSEYPTEAITIALNALCAEKRIRWGHTMHDKYFLPL